MVYKQISLIYILNDSSDRELEFQLIYYDKLIVSWLATNTTCYSQELNASIIKSPNFELSIPHEGTMGEPQYIKGFMNLKDKEQYIRYILHFNSNEIRDIYVYKLSELLFRLVRLSRQQIYSDNTNTRIIVKS